MVNPMHLAGLAQSVGLLVLLLLGTCQVAHMAKDAVRVAAQGLLQQEEASGYGAVTVAVLVTGC